ncbi:hypothetical protein AZE42_11182 [Rhizopogon vesiculosus]|uniref:Uncharacterized protein n=1 Tax=Rhizopogon vesiculosus TaxID=180088 RepID=A0A1J8QIP4_9AGAM|nr:hypothetical protein AZE42_11182 [Rhizopogon vesiculosus]
MRYDELQHTGELFQYKVGWSLNSVNSWEYPRGVALEINRIHQFTLHKRNIENSAGPVQVHRWQCQVGAGMDPLSLLCESPLGKLRVYGLPPGSLESLVAALIHSSTGFPFLKDLCDSRTRANGSQAAASVGVVVCESPILPFPSSTSTMMSTTDQNTQSLSPVTCPPPVDADLLGDDVKLNASKNPVAKSGTIEEKMSDTLGQILEVLQGSTIAEERGKDVESKFWATYKRISNEYDDDFLERANDDMAIILTFVCLSLSLSMQV